MMTMKMLARSTAPRVAMAAALIAACCGQAERAEAAEIRLLSAAAMQTIFQKVSGEFERTSGHKLVFIYATMGAITERGLAGETADLIISSTQSIDRLAKEGRIVPDSRVAIAKVGIGVVVPSGTPKPAIESPDDLTRALLAARTVVYARPAGGGAAGIHIARVIEQLGISEQVKPKTTFGAGGDVTEVTLAQGSGALGMTQISEIVDKPGADYVGPFPAEVQNYTGVTAGIPVGATPSAAVTDFITFLKSPAAVAAIKARGMEVEWRVPRFGRLRNY